MLVYTIKIGTRITLRIIPKIGLKHILKTMIKYTPKIGLKIGTLITLKYI